MNDWELLQTYLQQDSEPAFRTLVERYVNLVYSAAWRQTGQAALAEDITQAVFTILARKAHTFRPKTLLPGWLFRTTRHVALTALRTEHRRRRREHLALEMNTTSAQPDTWEEALPVLDEVLLQLAEADRNAILLRFFQQKSLHEVGLESGISEEAAKKRVARAIKKLRTLFAGRGIVLSGAALGTLLSSTTVRSAPPDLAEKASASALLKRSGVAVSALILVEEALRRTALAKAKLALLLSGGLIAVSFLGTVVWQTWHRPPAPAQPRSLTAAVARATQAAVIPPKTAEAVALPPALPLRVLAADTGRPFARVPIQVKYTGPGVRIAGLATDQEGLCRMPLAGHEFQRVTATVGAPGYVPKTADWFRYEIEAHPEPKEYTLRLDPGRRLEGELRDAGGQPVARAHLAASFAVSTSAMAEREQAASSSSETDSDGHWVLDQLPSGIGEIYFTIEHPDFALHRTNLVISDARLVKPLLVLQSGVSVAGIVVGDKGGPIWGATVTDNDRKGQPSRELSASSTSDGLFFFPHVSPGKLWLLARAEGYRQAEKELDLSSDVDGIRLVLSPDSKTNSPRQEPIFDKKLHLHGTVVDDATGEPIPRFKVLFGREFVWGHVQPVPSFQSLIAPPQFLGEGYDGEFDWNWPLQNRELNKFQLEVRAPGYAASISSSIEVSNNARCSPFGSSAETGLSERC